MHHIQLVFFGCEKITRVTFESVVSFFLTEVLTAKQQILAFTQPHATCYVKSFKNDYVHIATIALYLTTDSTSTDTSLKVKLLFFLLYRIAS